MSTGNIPSVLSGSQPVDRSAKPHKAAYDTTAALAQEDASNPNEAKILNRNASEERVAAEKAAEVARVSPSFVLGVCSPEG